MSILLAKRYYVLRSVRYARLLTLQIAIPLAICNVGAPYSDG